MDGDVDIGRKAEIPEPPAILMAGIGPGVGGSGETRDAACTSDVGAALRGVDGGASWLANADEATVMLPWP